MTVAAVILLAAIAILWLIGPWIHRRNARIAGARETTELHSKERGEP